MTWTTKPTDNAALYVSPTWGSYLVPLTKGVPVWVSIQYATNWAGSFDPYFTVDVAGVWSDRTVTDRGDGSFFLRQKFTPSASGRAWLAFTNGTPPTNLASLGTGSFAVIPSEDAPAYLWFSGSATPDPTLVASWAGAVNGSASVLSDLLSGVWVGDGTTTVGAVEIVAATLTRPLRREVIEIRNSADVLINAGTPGRLAGQITYLCASLSRALALDALYRGTATLTLTTGGEIDGLRHRAVDTPSMTAEKAVSGSPSRWLFTVPIREVAA
jgi:hypothetical protein